MDSDAIWVLIPLAPFLLGAFAIWMKHNRKIEEIRAAATAEKAAQYAAHSQALEDRVRVLERIVTDKGYDVSAQIDALRDTARIESPAAGDTGRLLS